MKLTISISSALFQNFFQKNPCNIFEFALFWACRVECTCSPGGLDFFNRRKNAILTIIWRATYFFILFFGGCPWPFFIDSNLPRLFGHFSLSKYQNRAGRGQSHAYFMRMFSQTFPPLLSTFDSFFNSIDLKFYFVTCQLWCWNWI